MVDFSKRLGKKVVEKAVDPRAIYDRLDRASDKGPLRQAQDHILGEWFKSRRADRDVIIKLHTGQGKTLIGLLILQSRLSEGKGPAVYFCPNKQLVEQSCEQAKQFGFSYCRGEDGIPQEFFDGKSILITTVQKLFNGLTQFGIGLKAHRAGAILLDDSHACVDAIRDAVTIKIPRKHPLHARLIDLFEADLKHQGVGTLEDIKHEHRDALLPIPYWSWFERANDVTAVFADYADDDVLKWVWPVLRNRIADCACVVASHLIEITPHLAPLDLFRTYWDAPHRVFMSATVTDDSFLIKGLRLAKETILNPLVYPGEKWSGEKMIIIPSLIHDDLKRSEIVHHFGTPSHGRKFGVVALVPSFAATKDWEAYGALVAQKNTIDHCLNGLRAGVRDKTLVLVNRYDGVDLPDDQCRVLVFDSLPFSENLLDRYHESCRPEGEMTQLRLARSIEQGLGRSVRGEKDYSVIIVTGSELVRFIRHQKSRGYLSDQTQKQIEIGLEASEAAQDDLKNETPPIVAMQRLVDQCIKRDEGWKAYYVEQMDKMQPSAAKARGLDVFETELRAESLYQDNDPDGATAILQELADRIHSDYEKGYYLQEIARYRYAASKAESNKMQIAAHRKNPYLLKPREGAFVRKLEPLDGRRITNVIMWIQSHGNYDQMKVVVDDILSRLEFGVAADDFERALQEVGEALGFASSRPDKEMKEGPDNLWCLQQGDYLLMEAKSRVLEGRMEIYKDESGQMNNACGWFKTTYPGAAFTRLMVIPTNKLGKGAAFNEEICIMRKQELGKLEKNIRAFFGEFRTVALKGIPEADVARFLDLHHLSIDALKSNYQKAVYAGAAR